MNDLCAHGRMRGHCVDCREERWRHEKERERARAALPAAVAAMNEWWRESEHGDYYPVTERVAAEHGIDVWVLRDAWLAPVHAARRALNEGGTA